MTWNTFVWAVTLVRRSLSANCYFKHITVSNTLLCPAIYCVK
jgi:hypothetical protein